MPGQVKLVVDAEMAKAFAAFNTLWEKQQRAEKAMEKIASAGDRAERSTSKATQSLVNRVQGMTNGANLAVSQADRVALRTGFNPGGGSLGNAIERRMVAQQLRDQRSFERYTRDAEISRIGRSVGSLSSIDAVLGRAGGASAAAAARRLERTAAGNERSMYAASVLAYGGLGRQQGESALEARARREVAANVAGAPELAGKVSPQDMETMVARRTAQLTSSAAMRRNIATGAGAVGAAVGAIVVHGINTAVDRSQEMLRENVAFQDQMTGLVGLGDNALNPGALKERVFAGAIGRGVNRQEVINALYQLQSTADNLPAGLQNEIYQQAGMLTKVKGGSLAENQTALVKMWQNYPETFKSPKDAANFIGAVEEKGSIDMMQLAKDAPDAFAAWKEAGYTLKDFAASVQVATTYTGDVEKAMIQVRNMPAHLLKAEKVLGIKFKSPDFIERVDQMGAALDKMSPDARLRALKGIDEERGLIVGSILTGQRADLRQQRDDFGGVGANSLFEKYRRRLSDPAYQSSEISKGLLALQENIPAMAAQEGRSMFNTETYEAAIAGGLWANRDKPWNDRESVIKNVKMELGMEGAMMLDKTDFDRTRYASLGFQLLYDKQISAAAGVKDRETYRQMTLGAEAMKVRHGSAFGLSDADGSQMDDADVQELLALYAQGYTPTAGGLREFHRLGGASSATARGWLDATQRSVPSGILTQYAADPNAPAAAPPASSGRYGVLPDPAYAARDILEAAKVFSKGSLFTNAHTE